MDIGLERAAFLYVSDVADNYEEFEALMQEEEEGDLEEGFGKVTRSWKGRSAPSTSTTSKTS